MSQDQLNMQAILASSRCAGGHHEIMDNLFSGASVIASYTENDWQGSLAYAYRLADGRIALVTDYFGSCSGCDSYEDASDANIKHLVTELANNAHVFATVDEAVKWIKGDMQADKAAYYNDSSLVHLLPELEKLVEL